MRRFRIANKKVKSKVIEAMAAECELRHGFVSVVVEFFARNMYMKQTSKRKDRRGVQQECRWPLQSRTGRNSYGAS